MFRPDQNAHLIKLAYRLYKTWKARGIYPSLGVEARRVFDAVESYEAQNKPKAFSDAEINNQHSIYIRQGYGYAAATRMTLAAVQARDTAVQKWETTALA